MSINGILPTAGVCEQFLEASRAREICARGVYHWLIMVYLQTITCNSKLEMVNVINKNKDHMSRMRYHMKALIISEMKGDNNVNTR